MNKGISNENFHGFVSKLVEVEKEVVSQNSPSPEKCCAEFYRNTSLARDSMLYEASKGDFAKDVYENLKNGHTDRALDSLANLEVPDFLQDHYKSIKTFYKENGNEMGVNTNLAFHAINGSIIKHAKKELGQDGVNKVIRATNKVMKATFDKRSPETYASLDSQIDGAKLDKQQLSAMKKASVQKFVEKNGQIKKPLGEYLANFKDIVSNVIKTIKSKISNNANPAKLDQKTEIAGAPKSQKNLVKKKQQAVAKDMPQPSIEVKNAALNIKEKLAVKLGNKEPNLNKKNVRTKKDAGVVR